jgi:hypothetical protein
MLLSRVGCTVLGTLKQGSVFLCAVVSLWSWLALSWSSRLYCPLPICRLEADVRKGSRRLALHVTVLPGWTAPREWRLVSKPIRCALPRASAYHVTHVERGDLLIAARRLTNVAAGKHFSVARSARNC